MDAKEYLRQAYRLDQKIRSDMIEVARLREMSMSISAPSLGEKVQTGRQSDAPYTRCVEKMLALEEKIDEEMGILVSLKEQMRGVIAAVPDADEQMVLRFRYIHNMTWERIGNEMNANARTVRRWHGAALLHVSLPKNPIKI